MLGNEGTWSHRPWGRGLWSSLCRMEVQEDESGVGVMGQIGRGWIRAMESWMTLGRPRKS